MKFVVSLVYNPLWLTGLKAPTNCFFNNKLVHMLYAVVSLSINLCVYAGYYRQGHKHIVSMNALFQFHVHITQSRYQSSEVAATCK